MERGGGIFDPELDLRPRQSRPGPNGPVEDYQRLVANPALGMMFWIAAFAVLRESVPRHNLALCVWSMLFVLVGVVFLQFHCLDCGKTGCLLRSRVHLCTAVVERQQSRLIRRFRGPGITLQLIIWFILVFAAFVLGMAALESRS